MTHLKDNQRQFFHVHLMHFGENHLRLNLLKTIHAVHWSGIHETLPGKEHNAIRSKAQKRWAEQRNIKALNRYISTCALNTKGLTEVRRPHAEKKTYENLRKGRTTEESNSIETIKIKRNIEATTNPVYGKAWQISGSKRSLIWKILQKGFKHASKAQPTKTDT